MSSCCAPKRPPKNTNRQVVLNIGGVTFRTSAATLLRAPGSELSALLDTPPDEGGAYFIDRDGSQFHHILNFLRDGPELYCAPTDVEARRQVRREATAYKISALVAALNDPPANDTPANGREAPANLSRQASPAEKPEYAGAPIPDNELERLSRLENLNILDTPEEHRFDAITRIVAALMDIEIVLVSLVHKEKQWFKSRVGLDAKETPRPTSFCAFTLKPERPSASTMFVIEDAHADPRVNENPLVVGPPFIRFYAGSPLLTSDGLRLGALCAISMTPRMISPLQAQLLVNFGQLTSNEIERQELVDTGELDLDEDLMPMTPGGFDFSCGLMRSSEMQEALRQALALVWARPDSLVWPILYANKVWEDMTGTKVTPPSKFPELATITGATGSVSNCVWDWLHMEDTGEDCIEQLFKRARVGSRSSYRGVDGDQATPFSVGARLMRDRKPGERSKLVDVTCRFMPGEMPISASAAAIQPVPRPNIGHDFYRELPRGFSRGRFFFVTVVKKDPSMEQDPSCGGSPRRQSSESIKEKNGVNEEDTPVYPSETSLQERPDVAKTQSEIERKTSDPRSDRPKLAKSAGLQRIRPPRTPFEDVKLLQAVGEGSFGKVYYGLWSGSAVAVKVIERPEDPREAEERAQGGKMHAPAFEGALSTSISHPNLVQTFKSSTRTKKPEADAEEVEQTVGKVILETWIVQEWCDGGTLAQHCTTPRLEEPGIGETLDITLEIASAGCYLHGRGIIHGDLTANNVLLKSSTSRKRFVCKVCDFGLARILEDSSQAIVTRSLGTVTHMPPEMFSADSDECALTPKADVWALGILLWQVVTGCVPYEHLSAGQVVVHVAMGRRLELPAEVRKEFLDLYNGCTATKMEDRPSFQDVVDQLQGSSMAFDSSPTIPTEPPRGYRPACTSPIP